jgi:hypothetical protein
MAKPGPKPKPKPLAGSSSTTTTTTTTNHPISNARQPVIVKFPTSDQPQKYDDDEDMIVDDQGKELLSLRER